MVDSKISVFYSAVHIILILYLKTRILYFSIIWPEIANIFVPTNLGLSASATCGTATHTTESRKKIGNVRP